MSDHAPTEYAPRDIEERLHAAGTEFRSRPVPDVALRWPAESHRSRLLAPLAVATGVAAVIAGVTIAVSSSDQRAPTSPAKPSPQALPQPDPSYAVALPPDYSTGGPALVQRAPCAVGSVSRTVTTRPTKGGLLGLITLNGGRQQCTLTADPSTIRLLDDGGRAIAIPVSKGNLVNPPANSPIDRYEFADGRIGFAWTGSYCGPEPASVEMDILGSPVRIPLHGAVLPCVPGASSQLIPGTFAPPNEAVEPAPVEWQALKLRLVIPARVEQKPIPLQLVLTNTGTRPVTLADPCPTYTGVTSVDVGGNISAIGGPGGDLCDAPRVIQPGKAVTITLPPMEFPTFSDLPRTHVSSGDPVRVIFSMSGVEPATAMSQVR